MPLVDSIAKDDDTILILITTDNHVGYNENDPIRGEDSWKTFEEIIGIAKDKDVDMILQGGDLFHINKPSKTSMYQVLKIIKENCFGNKPCELELLSDPSKTMGNDVSTLNYEDPNLNISLPIFAVSGNHDDASGKGFLLPLDLLSVSGMINHFGIVSNNENIEVSPLLLRKGSTKLALYGLANVKDERLFRTFRDGNVRFFRPTEDASLYFNLLCVHQNHSAHSRTSYLPELFLPSFLDFVLWGHEHECIPNPTYNPENDFYTLQAGSSVATSLCEAEACEKYVFIMNIKQDSFAIESIKLNTVRPFIMDEVSLIDEKFPPGEASKDDISKFLTLKVEELIERAKSQTTLSPNTSKNEASNQQPLPLIRLKVEYSGDYIVENPRRFSNKFVGRIANVDDVILYYKRKTTASKTLPNEANLEAVMTSRSSKNNDFELQDVIKEFLKQSELSLLPEEGISYAVERYFQNDDKHILNDYIKNEIERETRTFLKMDINQDEFNEDSSKETFKALLAQIKRKSTYDNKINLEKHIDDGLKVSSPLLLDIDAEDAPVKSLRLNSKSQKPTNKASKSEEIVISDSEDEIEKMDVDKDVDMEDEDFQVSISEEEEPSKSVIRGASKVPRKKTDSSSSRTKKKSTNTRPSKSKKPASDNSKRSLLDDIMSMGK